MKQYNEHSNQYSVISHWSSVTGHQSLIIGYRKLEAGLNGEETQHSGVSKTLKVLPAIAYQPLGVSQTPTLPRESFAWCSWFLSNLNASETGSVTVLLVPGHAVSNRVKDLDKVQNMTGKPKKPTGGGTNAAGKAKILTGTAHFAAGLKKNAAGRAKSRWESEKLHRGGSNPVVEAKNPVDIKPSKFLKTFKVSGNKNKQERTIEYPISNVQYSNKNTGHEPQYGIKNMNNITNKPAARSYGLTAQKIKTASCKIKLSSLLPPGEMEKGFFLLSPFGGVGGGFVANILKLIAYET